MKPSWIPMGPDATWSSADPPVGPWLTSGDPLLALLPLSAPGELQGGRWRVEAEVLEGQRKRRMELVMLGLN